ncbi:MULTISPECIES: hypothetical protein [Pseudomonas]|uniref:hypothetical protein n=1 Tax=Pseudomonas TaxID=286 RepID=UPI0025AA70C5|nr:hypothetical protein [Pseudomonas asiatica]MDM9555974.1 hypothetical protein [Pseudomonas asiatica]
MNSLKPRRDVVGSEIDRVKDRSASRQLVEKLFQDAHRVFVVHYSCESFYENATGASLRVTSIAIRNLKSAQTKSWSLHATAELLGMLESMPTNLDNIEKRMLDGYFEFLRTHADCQFLHWNMRDNNYGFYAVEHRHRALGGNPYELQDANKHDLARILVSLYGHRYAPHSDSAGRRGRIMGLAELNNITDKDALTGEQEAAAYVAGDFLTMHRSTLRKLDMFANFFDRAHQKTLKTTSTWMDRVGVHPVAVIEWAKSHPLITGLLLLGSVLGAVTSFGKFWTWVNTVL